MKEGLKNEVKKSIKTPINDLWKAGKSLINTTSKIGFDTDEENKTRGKLEDARAKIFSAINILEEMEKE